MFGTYRTFLALMVVALHLGGISMMATYAVFGFYCLSGYLMTLIMQNNYGYSSKGIAKYAVNRFLRIYPIYWVSVLFSAVLIWYLGDEFVRNYHDAIYLPTSFAELARNLMLFFPVRELPRLTPPAWALTVEIFFYILIGLGLSKTKRITLIWFALSVVYHCFVVGMNLGWIHKYFTVTAASMPFATGALIYHYRDELTQYGKYVGGTLNHYLPLIFMLAILGNWYIGDMLSLSDGVFFYSNFILCASMVVILLNRKELPFISKGFDKWMGDFSYPIYLLHYQIGLVVIVVFASFGIEMERPNLLLMYASLPVIFILSWLITVTLERPVEYVRTRVKG